MKKLASLLVLSKILLEHSQGHGLVLRQQKRTVAKVAHKLYVLFVSVGNVFTLMLLSLGSLSEALLWIFSDLQCSELL